MLPPLLAQPTCGALKGSAVISDLEGVYLWPSPGCRTHGSWRKHLKYGSGRSRPSALAKLPKALWPCKIIKTVYALSMGGSENGRWERWISGYQKVEGSSRMVQDEVGVWFETRDVVVYLKRGMPGMPR
jgi:hypothetical protein